MLLYTQLLQANVVLEHFPEVDCHTLANGPVNWIINVEFFKRVIARVKHGQDTNDAVMFNLVVSKVEGEHFIMREEEFGYHHCSVCLNFVAIQIEHLQVSAVLQRLGKVLRTITLNLVSL